MKVGRNTRRSSLPAEMLDDERRQYAETIESLRAALKAEKEKVKRLEKELERRPPVAPVRLRVSTALRARGGCRRVFGSSFLPKFSQIGAHSF